MFLALIEKPVKGKKQEDNKKCQRPQALRFWLLIQPRLPLLIEFLKWDTQTVLDQIFE